MLMPESCGSCACAGNAHRASDRTPRHAARHRGECRQWDFMASILSRRAAEVGWAALAAAGATKATGTIAKATTAGAATAGTAARPTEAARTSRSAPLVVVQHLTLRRGEHVTHRAAGGDLFN